MAKDFCMANMKASYYVSVERESTNPERAEPFAIWMGAEEIEEEAEKTAAFIWGKKEEMTRPFDSTVIRVRDMSTEHKDILWENGAKVVTRPAPPSKRPAPPSKTADDDDKASLLKRLEEIMNKLNGMG